MQVGFIMFMMQAVSFKRSKTWILGLKDLCFVFKDVLKLYFSNRE